MTFLIALFLAAFVFTLASCQTLFNESSSLCNKTFADADGYGTFSWTDPFPGGWAWTVLKNKTTAQGSLWYSPKGANYSDDLALEYDVCFIAVQGVNNLTLWQANSDSGNCHSALDPVCVSKLNSIAQARANLLTANGDSNLTNGDLPSICVDIANTIQGGFPHECNKYFDFLTVAGYAMTGLNGVDKDSCCSDLTAFTQGCHITGEGEIGQYPYYPVGWLWDTNHLEHNFINYSRTLVPALNVWMPPANRKRIQANDISSSRMTCVRLDHWNEGADRVPPQPSPPSTHHGLSGGDIAGIVVGCVAVVAIAVGTGFWFWRRRRRQASSTQATELEATTRTAAKIGTGELGHGEVSEAPHEHSYSEAPDAERRHEMPAGEQKAEMVGDDAAHELAAEEVVRENDKKPREDGNRQRSIGEDDEESRETQHSSQLQS